MDIILIIKSVFLGIIEGITEFLPISSTGHLIVFERLFHFTDNEAFNNSFEVIIQLGAILAVVIIYFWRLWPFWKDMEKTKERLILWVKIAIAVVPAVVITLLFDDYVTGALFIPAIVAICLIFYGIVILIVEHFLDKIKSFAVNDVNRITFLQALLIGIFQCLAIIPGTSRSLATILGGVLLGLSRTAALEFSFFLAIPTMFGASTVMIYKNGLDFTVNEWMLLAIGFVVSFIVAFIVIKMFLNFVKKHSFRAFGIYRIALGIIVLIMFL